MGKILDAVDTKALRFAIGFPVLLAAGFAVCAVLLRPDLPEPLAVMWNNDGGTAFAQTTVVFDVVPGTLLFAASDPDLDDNGPGTYDYPNSSAFVDGAFDLQAFEVYDSGPDTVTFRVRTRDLTPTFGSPLGAQLIDVYLRDYPHGRARKRHVRALAADHLARLGIERIRARVAVDALDADLVARLQLAASALELQAHLAAGELNGAGGHPRLPGSRGGARRLHAHGRVRRDDDLLDFELGTRHLGHDADDALADLGRGRVHLRDQLAGCAIAAAVVITVVVLA